MKHHTIALLLIALLAGSVQAQSRTRPPPSKPATQEEVAALRAAVEELRQQVAELQDQVAALIESLKTAKPADKDRAAEAAAVRGNKIVNGMTLPQVERLAGNRGELESSIEGVTVYRFRIEHPKAVIDGGADYPQTLFGQFENGKLNGIELRRAPVGSGRVVSPGTVAPGR